MSLKKKLTMTVATTTIGALVMGAGTFALFTNQQTVAGQTFATGTLKLASGMTQTFQAGTTGLEPGQTVSGSFMVKNDGTLPLKYMVTANTSGNLFTSGDWNWDGTPDTNHAVVKITANQTGDLQYQNNTANVTYTVTLPDNAGNDFQDQSGNLSFTVNAVQYNSASGSNGWMPAVTEAPTITEGTASIDSSNNASISFKIVDDDNINLGQESFGDVKIIFGHYVNNVFTPFTKADGITPLMKSKTWSGYLNSGGSKYGQGIGPDSSTSYSNSLPINALIQTSVNASAATMAYANDLGWQSALSNGSVKVKVVVTDNQGNTTEQIITPTH